MTMYPNLKILNLFIKQLWLTARRVYTVHCTLYSLTDWTQNNTSDKSIGVDSLGTKHWLLSVWLIGSTVGIHPGIFSGAAWQSGSLAAWKIPKMHQAWTVSSRVQTLEIFHKVH